jgi:signaling intermediate in Toll pathway protein
VGSLPVPLTAEPPRAPRAPSVHEQDDGTILAVCATGSSSHDSLLSWVRHLEVDGNPALATVPVLFTLRSNVADKPAMVGAAEGGKLE